MLDSRSHRSALRNISNGSHRNPEPCTAADLGPSPRESPRLHLRSSSSRVPSCLLLIDKVEMPSNKLDDTEQAHPKMCSVEIKVCTTEEDRAVDSAINPTTGFSPTPDYNPYRVQTVPRQRSIQPYITIHGLDGLATSPFRLYNPQFREIRNELKTFPIEHLDTCSSWSQMSIETSELLFLVQNQVIFEIQSEVQPQLRDIKHHDYILRKTSLITDGVTEHLIRLDMDSLMYSAVRRILEYSSCVIGFNNLQRLNGLVVLFLTSLRCIDWMENVPGGNHGVMRIHVVPARHPSTPTESSTYVQVVKHHDTISFGNTSLVLKEGQEIMLFPEYRRCKRPLVSDLFRSIKFELGSDVPWLQWDPFVSAFRGQVSCTQAYSYSRDASHSKKTEDQAVIQDSKRQPLSIIIKATLLERHWASELRLKTVIRARVTLDILPWWSDTCPSPWSHLSLRNAKRPPISYPAYSTIPRHMKLISSKPNKSKPLLSIFSPPTGESPSCPPGFSPEMRGRHPISDKPPENNSTKKGPEQEQIVSSRVFSFEKNSESNFVTRKLGDLRIETSIEQGRAGSSTKTEFQACGIRLVQPSATLIPQSPSQITCIASGSTSSTHSQRNEPPLRPLRRLKRKRLASSDGSGSSGLSEQIDAKSSDLQHLIDLLTESAYAPGDQTAWQSKVGGRFAPLLDIASRGPSYSSQNTLTGGSTRDFSPNPIIEFCSDAQDVESEPALSSPQDVVEHTHQHQAQSASGNLALAEDPVLSGSCTSSSDYLVLPPEEVETKMRQMQEFYEQDKSGKVTPRQEPDTLKDESSEFEMIYRSDDEDYPGCKTVDEAELEGMTTSPQRSNSDAGGSDRDVDEASDAASNESLSEIVVDDIEPKSLKVRLRFLRGRKKGRRMIKDWGGKPGQLFEKMSPRRQ